MDPKPPVHSRANANRARPHHQRTTHPLGGGACVEYFALFGAPSHIAEQHTHRQSERTLLLKWLRTGEALMRHLPLIEAAH